MLARRSGPLILAAVLAAAGCKDVSKRSPVGQIVVATYASPIVPTPNDLALQATPTLPVSAQRDLLQSFVDAGGFPVDQAPTLSVPLASYEWDPATSKYVASPDSSPKPRLDPASVTADTAALFQVDVSPPRPVPIEPAAVQADGSISLVPAADSSGSRRLAPGRYVFAVRGGANGVKTTDALPIAADVPVALTIPNKNLASPANQPPGGLSAEQVTQLETIRALLWNPVAWLSANLGTGNVWIPCLPTVLASAPAPLQAACTAANGAVSASAYAAIDAAFPHGEVASIAAFQIAPSAGTVPLVDAASGQAPLPIDLLRTGPGGTIARNPAFGPAAAGLATLDGFSTTAMMLAPTSFPVDASTVNGGSVMLFRLSAAGVPSPVPELKALLGTAGDPTTAGYVAQPTAITVPQGTLLAPSFPCPPAGGCSPTIGLQPAVPAPVPAVGTFYLPPLAENTSYAVVITNRVHDVLGQPLVPPTIMTLLLDSHPIAASGVSLVGGVDAATATALETMRGQLAPVMAALGGDAANVVLAYTFKTQSFKITELQLAAAPYSIEKVAAQAIFTPAAAVAVTAPVGVPTTGVGAFYDVTFTSLDVIDKTTGALRPTLADDLADPATVATLLTPLHALVAVPEAGALPLCPAPPFPAGARCTRLVVFGHGLNGSKETLFATASSLASAGFVAAAIDFPLHGSRNWCSQSSDCVVTSSGADGTCTPFPGGAGQGDTVPPGQCTDGSVPRIDAAHVASRYFIGANFFRTRDAFRQDVLDVGALVLALARPPTVPQPAANPFATALVGSGIVVDPTTAYYEGLSLGSMAGTEVMAANSRLSRASLSVGGGTLTDVFTNSPSFQPSVSVLFTKLLAGALGGATFSFDMINPASPAFDLGVAEAYLQTINVAKWVLDPGDPVNYAANLEAEPLPDLLADPTGATPQAAKAIYGQIAEGDIVVPNPFNNLLYTLIGADQTLYSGAGASHGMLALQPQVQIDAAGFLAGSVPPTARTLP